MNQLGESLPNFIFAVVNLDPTVLEKRWTDGESWPYDFGEKVNRGEDLRWVGSRWSLTHALKTSKNVKNRWSTENYTCKNYHFYSTFATVCVIVCGFSNVTLLTWLLLQNCTSGNRRVDDSTKKLHFQQKEVAFVCVSGAPWNLFAWLRCIKDY